jgi:AmmeMemoRadiSam system radical SAM enzyme
MDAANVDLKGFTEDFYRTYCSGRLQPVLDTLRWLVHESHTWVEITNLIIPQANDSPEEIGRMCQWIAAELGLDVPLHFSAFHPDFKLTDRGSTPPDMLRAAYEIAKAAGLRYVYTGNVYDPDHQHTYCPGCGRVVICRNGYTIGAYELQGGCCAHCQTPIAGRFDEMAGTWGGKRIPIMIEK